MIEQKPTDELRKYINSQLKLGESKQNISRKLIESGWDKNLVELILFNKQTPPKATDKSNKKIIMIILSIIFAVGVVTASTIFLYGFFSVGTDTLLSLENNTFEEEFSICYDFTCMRSQALDCGPAIANISYVMDIFGMKFNTTYSYELKPFLDRCSLYSHLLTTDIILDEETVGELLQDGLTMQEIEELSDETSQEFEDLHGTCIFDNTTHLVQYLDYLQEGDFQTSITCQGLNCESDEQILVGADCSGPLFGY